MDGKWIARILLILFIIGGGLVIGTNAYQAGLAAGIAQGGGTVVAPWPAGYGWGAAGFGWGFPFFGFLGFVLFVLFLAVLIRAATGGRPGWRGPGRWSARDERVEEWHRRMHERAAGQDGDRSMGGTAGQTGDGPA
jgi:hypothetical protein